jgi:hypothetical protein
MEIEKITVLLPAVTAAAVREIAKKENRSMTAQMKTLVDEALVARQLRHGNVH